MGISIPYKQDLNPSQLEAVLYNESPLLVLAGAGSGKTRVITYKIAYLINECGFNPRDILAVTFTNKASNEMKDRVKTLLGTDVDIWIKTFHSTSAKILRVFGNYFGVQKSFSIIDEHDQITMVNKIVKNMKIDPDTYKADKYVYLINRAKDSLLNADDALKEDFSTDSVFYEIYHTYENILNRDNLFDFGDLLFKLVKGIDRNSKALKLLKDRFRYILVDEFQDTNHAQYVLIKRLSLPEGKICVVGDDDQSIYGFRGARVENILKFQEGYKNAKIIKLEENYRSFQTILTASSHLIDRNSGRLGKTLYTRKGTGEKLLFYHASTDFNEALYIAEEIQNLIFHKGYVYSDIAVFYRMNAQSRVFESIFSQCSIPYTIVGGLRFYEREEIKDILSYIRLAMNPMDEISLRRVIAKPPRGMGQKTVEGLIQSSIARGYPFYRALEDLDVPSSRIRIVNKFIDFIHELSEMIDNTYPPELLRKLYDTSGYIEWLNRRGREEKIRNLDELYNAVEEFSKRNPSAPISEFIEEVSLNQGAPEEDFQSDRVSLITLHNAKGLEFPVVFIAGMEDGTFPHFLSGQRSSDIEEERRLCYVGMTRAMEKLYLTAAKARKLYGRSIQRGVSTFVHEIPAELLIYNEENGLENGSISYYDIVNRKASTYFRRERKEAVPFKNRNAERCNGNIKAKSRIIHRDYGRGKVLEVDGGVAVIKFDDGKVMKFMLNYTPIMKDKDNGD